MKRLVVIFFFQLFSLISLSQTLSLENYYGIYMGIDTSDIYGFGEVKKDLILSIEKNQFELEFNQLDNKKWFHLTPDINAPKWDYSGNLTILEDNLIRLRSGNLFFDLKVIDSLRLKIVISNKQNFINDTLYRVSGRRYIGESFLSDWTYYPNSSILGETIWFSDYYITYPVNPVWYYNDYAKGTHVIIKDSLYSNPLTKKIRKEIKQ